MSETIEPNSQNSSIGNASSNQANNTIRSEKPFEFYGTTSEYFRIWIVNVLLSIVTLGIYSAWAKVRTKRYFYGNTVLDGSSFDYTAEPLQILKGRVIALVLIIAYQIIAQFWPQFGGIAFTILVILLPFIIVVSMRFRMRNTVWRGIRFGFDTRLKQAYLLFSPPIIYAVIIAALPFIMNIDLTELDQVEQSGNTSAQNEQLLSNLIPYFIALGVAVIIASLIFPWWQKKYYEFIGNQSRFGSTNFSFSALSVEFYGLYFIAFLLLIASFIVVGILFAIITFAGTLVGGNQAIMVFAGLLFLLPYLITAAYLLTKRTNIIYSNLGLDEITFDSRLATERMAYFYITNTVAILLTLGLAIPWAMIRVAKYRASTITLRCKDLTAFTSQQIDHENAVGEEVGEMFGLDIGL